MKLPGGIAAATLVISLVVAFMGAVFSHGLNVIIDLNQKFPVLVFLLPLLLWLTLTLEKRVELMSSAVNHSWKSNSLVNKATVSDLLLLPFCWLSHLGGASVGRESVAVQLGRGISHVVGACFGLLENPRSREILMRVGMASGFAAVFGTPWTGLVFSFEWKSVQQEDDLGREPMFDAVKFDAVGWAALGSAASWWMASQILKVPHSHFEVERHQFDLHWMVFLIVMLSFATGLAWLHNKSGKLFTRWFELSGRSVFLRVFLPSVILILLFKNEETAIYRGLGLEILELAFSSGSSAGLDFWDPLLKSMVTVFCLSAGFKGGEVTPLLAMGASSGYVLAEWIGVPTQAAAAVGFPLLFALVFSVPLSCLVFSFEFFGFEHGLSGAALCFLLLMKRVARHY
ncbi:MAG: chloride channel protein [Silvanigrellaceae bacterium]